MLASRVNRSLRLQVQAVARPTPLGLRTPQRASVTTNVAATLSTTGIEFPRKAVSSDGKLVVLASSQNVRFSSAAIEHTLTSSIDRRMAPLTSLPHLPLAWPTFETPFLPSAGRRTHSGHSLTLHWMWASWLLWLLGPTWPTNGETPTTRSFTLSLSTPSCPQVALAPLLVCSGHHVLGPLCGRS